MKDKIKIFLNLPDNLLNESDEISLHSEKIVIEKQVRKQYYRLLDKVFDSNYLSEGPMNLLFAKRFGDYVNMSAVTMSGGGPSLLALLSYVNVAGKEVIVPTNSCLAVPLAVIYAGGKVVFADCKKDDLCIGVENIEKVLTKNTKAVIVVHIGGHLAFDILAIKKFCERRNIILIEDCCHADGASYKGIYGGGFGIGGAYSFHASKTLLLGEGGMVVSKHKQAIDFVKKFKNYGWNTYKPIKTTPEVKGFNFNMSEIIAAFGIVQLKKLPEILAWKKKLAKKYDNIFKRRIYFPPEMIPNYYKYIVFDTKINDPVGKVYKPLCHELMGIKSSFPDSEWVSLHHECVPIYYGFDKATLGIEALKEALLVEED